MDILHDEDIEIEYSEDMIPLLEALLVDEEALTESIAKTNGQWGLRIMVNLVMKISNQHSLLIENAAE